MQNQPQRSPQQPSTSFMAVPSPTPEPANGGGQPTTSPGSQAMLTFHGVLREIRAEAQHLQAALMEIHKSSELENAETRGTEIKAALQNAQGVFARNRDRINSLLLSVRQIFQQNPVIYDWCSDEVTHIENCWERLGDCWPETDQAEDQIVRHIDAANASLDRLIYLCGQLTIPARVNQHLQLMRIGQTLDFHKNFKDEVEKDEDRLRILAYMSDHPHDVQGVVDVKNGVIYRAASQPWRRRQSYLMLLVALFAGVGLLFAMTKLDTWLGLTGWPFANRFQELIAAYVFLLVGALAHVLVNALKQSHESKGSGLVAVDDWLLWTHVKESALLMGIVYVWIGLLGLAYTTTQITWTTAIFVGYSVDSFVDLFLQRFSQVASAHTAAMQEKIPKMP